MENNTNINIYAINDNLPTDNRDDDKKVDIKENINTRYSLKSKSEEDSMINVEKKDDNIKVTENISYKENELSSLLEGYETSFEKKSYKELVKGIEEKENLLFHHSKISFEIKIIKLKSLLKLLLEEYDIFLQSRNKSFVELDEMIIKINNEFQKTSKFIINNEPYIYEISTQIYCKFLYLLSKISIKREDYIKSLGYVSLGISMVKIFFMKKKIARDIKTYKIYCQLVIELIHILIGDNNYEQALYYVRLLLKIIESTLKYIYNYNDENKDQIPVTKIKKFIKYGGIAYIYTGCCLEQLDDPIQAFEAYKEAIIFLKKSAKLGFSFQNFSSITISNSCVYLVEEVFEKLKLKFEKDKVDRINKQKKLEQQKKKEELELLEKEKSMKLKYIADGLVVDPSKLERTENKLYKIIFPSSVVNNLEKMDNEITSFVYTYYDKNKKNSISAYNKNMSSDTKNLMSRYELYNILMSKKFRGFIKKTKNLQFYNPKTSSRCLSLIQKHLNNKIIIDANTKKISQTPLKSSKLMNNTIELTETNNRTNTNENFIHLSTDPSSAREDNKIKDKINFLRNANIKIDKDNLKYTLTQDKETIKNKIFNKFYPSLDLNIKKMVKTKFKYKLEKNFNQLPSDFERKNLDKNLITKNRIKKYFYYDKLSGKELKFQKQFLNFKFNNTLYNKNRTIDDKDGLMGKDELENIATIVNENASVKPIIKENIDINLLKDTFGSKQNKISLGMKSAMSSVINKYIKERTSRLSRQNLINPEHIRKINQKSIFDLDNYIKKISINISEIETLKNKSK